MIKYRGDHGLPVYIDPFAVVAVKEANSNWCKIYTAAGSFTVQGQVDEIVLEIANACGQ